jgi:8-oxo-dGTP pyrophosphatase MutT (NUDIX family)
MPAIVRHGRVANAPVSISAEGSPKARIVAALLRDGTGYSDVTDLPGAVGIRRLGPARWARGAGELPAAALARELREELGIDIAAPWGPPVQEVRADTFDMQIWLIQAWMGSPVNVAPDEHDATA